MPRPTSARPSPPFHAGTDADRRSREIASIDVGSATIEIDRDAADCVAITVSVGDHAFFSIFDAAKVTRWCEETSLMLATALNVAAGDELTVRSPMLVAQHQGCVAMGRRIADGQSVLSLHFASSPDDLLRGAALDSGPASAQQANAFLAALRKAAVAATTPSGTTG